MKGRYIFGVPGRDGGVIDVSDSMIGAMNYARRHGYLEIYARFTGPGPGYAFKVADLVAGPRGGAAKWVRTARGCTAKLNGGKEYPNPDERSPWRKHWTVIGVYPINGEMYVDIVGPGTLAQAKAAAPGNVALIAVLPGNIDTSNAYFIDSLEGF